jgi:hypothetical protein
MATEQLDPTVDSAPAPKPRKKSAPKRKPAVTDPNETVTLTRAQLDELVARLSGAPTPVSEAATVTSQDFLGAVKEIIKESRPVEKITVANRVPHNPMNPTNEPRSWKYKFFQNFEEVELEDVTPLEYELIPQLKPGLFIKSRKGVPLVEVVLVKRGNLRGLHLRYDNSKADKAIELQTYAPTLEIMLQKCINEFVAQQKLKADRRAAGLSDEDED